MVYDEKEVLVTMHGNVALVEMVRAPVNAFNRGMYDQTRRVFQQIAEDRNVHAVVLTGRGKVFCGGNELREFVDLTFDSATEHLAFVRICFNAIYDCPVPVVGAINGAAVGTGWGLATLCDIRIAAESAVFALPEIDVGVLGGSRHTMRIAPQGMTRLMMYTGRRINARHALSASMVDEVVADDQVLDHSMTLAQEIAAKNPEAIRLAKRGLNQVESMSLKEGYEFECTLTASLRRVENIGEQSLKVLRKTNR